MDLDSQVLQDCANEPIRVINKIQVFGCLLAADRKFERFTHASRNVGDFFKSDFHQVIGQECGLLLSAEAMHEVRNIIGHSTIDAQREHAATIGVGRRLLDLSVHRSNDHYLLEFIPRSAVPKSGADAISRVSALMTYLHAERDDPTALLELAVSELRNMTRYNRVMAYRFLPDGSGEIVAEARAAHVDSFLGLRYPAWDIPQQARELYRTTPIRVIADVLAADEPLVPLDAAAPPLDMSLALLRGTSPVHLQYLQNMGVRSTLTLPLVVADELWGLLAMHHATPRAPSPDLLSACELAGRLVSMVLDQAQRERHQRIMTHVSATTGRVIAASGHDFTRGAEWEDFQSELSAFISADGLMCGIDGCYASIGEPLSDGALRSLQRIADDVGEDVVGFDDLPKRLIDDDLGDYAGALLIRVSRTARLDIIYLRKRFQKTIRWAGKPEKTIAHTDDGPKLTPRQSFATYSDQVKDRSDAWTADELDIAHGLKEALGRATEVSQELKEQRDRLGLLVHELNHRVRNILALVRSLTTQAKTSATSVEAYSEAIENRVLALASAHNLLTQAGLGGVSLRQLLTTELQPFMSGQMVKEALRGPEVTVRPQAASMIALVFHELASNAVKHGSLSVAEGRVTVDWRLEDGGWWIQWRELGGPNVMEPTRNGFGRSMVERAFVYEFDGRADLAFERSGVVATFWLPHGILAPTDAPGGSPPPGSPAAVVTKVTPELERRGLVVEDSFILAEELKWMLLRLGFSAVDAASSTEEAHALLDTHRYSFGLLDINLRGEFSFNVATRLADAGISFAFATGYGDTSALPERFADAALLVKPIDESALMAVLPDQPPPSNN